MATKRERRITLEKKDIGINTSLREFSSIAEDESEIVSLSETASSTPDAKKGKMDLTLQDLQDNIMCAINNNTEKIMERINNNATAIDGINTQLNHLLQDMGEAKENVDALKTQFATYETRIKELEEKLEEQDRYHRRWNLRLFGLPERDGENIRKTATEICCGVAPELADLSPFIIDVCHRLGPRRESRSRPV